MARIEKRGCWGGRLVERAGRRYCCGMDMAGVMAMEGDEQYRGTLRKPKIGISWRYTGEGLICLCPSHHLKAESREKRAKSKEIKKRGERRFFLSPQFFSGCNPVDISREHRTFLDVGDAEEAGGDALEADGEAAVRRHAVFPALLSASVPAPRLSACAARTADTGTPHRLGHRLVRSRPSETWLGTRRTKIISTHGA